jgi:hypothetical protein
MKRWLIAGASLLACCAASAQPSREAQRKAAMYVQLSQAIDRICQVWQEELKDDHTPGAQDAIARAFVAAGERGDVNAACRAALAEEDRKYLDDYDGWGRE